MTWVAVAGGASVVVVVAVAGDAVSVGAGAAVVGAGVAGGMNTRGREACRTTAAVAVGGGEGLDAGVDAAVGETRAWMTWTSRMAAGDSGPRAGAA